MGYFSELDLEFHEENNEPWNRNIWLLEKIEELRDILEHFYLYGEPMLGEKEELYMYTDKDLLYMLPEDFRTIGDLERAIDICKGEMDENFLVEDIDKNNTYSVEDENRQLAA